MKKIFLLFICFNTLQHSNAQLLKKLKDKVSNVVNSTEDKAVNGTVDKVEKKARNAVNGKNATEQPIASATNPSNAEKEIVAASNTASTQSFSAYQNYDFIAGDKIVFEDNFTDDETGEFPSHWNMVSGQGTVNDFNGKKSLMMTTGASKVTPAIKRDKYLTDSFTIEIDHYAKTRGYGFQIYFYESDKDAQSQKTEPAGEIDFCSANSFIAANFRVGKGEYLKADFPDKISGDNYRDKWHHVAITFINKKLKLYVDEIRVLSIPNFNVNAKSFLIKADGSASTPCIFSNVRIANGGGMKVNEKKFTDVKIVTHGITFDIDKATIKPESMGTLNMIVNVMNNNPDIKFEIQGHTDNSGNSEHNMQLSQQRAEAVKSRLVKMGINAERLTSKGLGSTKPIVDNSTPEGKANNRRVEFVKM